MINKMQIGSTIATRSRIMWCMRLHSAFRTAFACTIVGCTTLYFPKTFLNLIKFPAFAYLTAMLIMCDATLVDALRGCWRAFYATVQVVPISMLVLWVVNRDTWTTSMATLGVALGSFLVALPQSSHLMTKRIAFGQIVIVCSDAAFSDANESGPGFIQPLHVAASTGLGAAASVLALLLPFPWLADNEVRKLCRIYAENASERMSIYLKAFEAQENQMKMELISQAKPFARTGTKLLQSISFLQESMLWKRYWWRCPETPSKSPADRLLCMEIPMRGMESALLSSPAIPAQAGDQEELFSFLQHDSKQIDRKIDHVKCLLQSNSVAEQEAKIELTEKPLQLIPAAREYEPFLFFLSCIDMFLNDSRPKPNPKSEIDTTAPTMEGEPHQEKAKFSIKRLFKSWISTLSTSERLLFSFKCSLSLGLAELLGLIFNKENSRWAGLIVAISFITGRQAVLTISNSRAQGTAIGSVYGVFCCFLFKHHASVRFLALLPFIIFTNFLGQSRMYGRTGGISAAIGALLILGRNNYGIPNEFAVIRLAQVFIGLFCFIAVELLLRPNRAASLAKTRLHLSLVTLQDCIQQTSRLHCGQKGKRSLKFEELEGKRTKLKSLVCILEKFTAESELEPDFWYLPFRRSCYKKIIGSLSNISDLLYFIIYNLEILSELLESYNIASREFQEQMNIDLQLFLDKLNCSLKCLQDGLSIESTLISPEPEDKKFRDLEEGRLYNSNNTTEEGDSPRHVSEIQNAKNSEEKEDLGERMIICSGAIRFCINSLRKEFSEIEIGVQELVQWEKHSGK